MKHLNLIIFLLSCVSLQAQDYLRPLTFDVIQPSWQQFIIDSTTLNDPKKNGFDHLTTTFLLVEESDEIAYFIHWDFSERYQGAFIQKRNVLSGAVLWTSLYNLTNSESHEFPRSAYLDDDGNLAIVNLRNNDPEFATTVWFKASPAIRIYDKSNGQLINYIHANDAINEDNEILFFTGLNNITITSPNNIINHIQLKPKSFSDTTYFIKKEYNQIGSFNRIDTSYHKRPYTYYFDNGFSVLKNKKIFNLHHSHNQNYQTVYESQNFDQYSLVVDIYEDDLVSKRSTDLTDVFPYNWKINYSGDNGQEYWLVCGDSLDADRFTERSSKALVFVAMDGTVKEIIDFEDNRYERIYAIKETNSEGALVITQDFIQKQDLLTNEFISEIIFWKSDGNGKLSKLHTLNYRDDRTLTISSASLLGKNMVLGTYMRKYENVSDLFPKYQMKGLLGFNIDLISDTKESNILSTRLKVYPNPTNSIIHIQGLQEEAKVIIQHINGKVIKTVATTDGQVDISELPNSLYIFEIQNKFLNERHKVLKVD